MKKGFTIIELLIVVTIIVIISSLVLVGVRNAQVSARDGKRIADISQIKKSIASYYIDPQFSKFPPSTPNAVAQGCGNWQVGNREIAGGFLNDLVTGKYATVIPLEVGKIKNDPCTYKYLLRTIPAGSLCAPAGKYAFIFARCEGTNCTTNESPSWCNNTCGTDIPECTDDFGKDSEKILYILKEGAGDAIF
jgi:prepilin-type N-terminal cleavage/methylation domain-containing protein